MKSYREIADSVFARREQYVIAQRKKKQLVTRVTASVGSVALVSLASFALFKSDAFRETPPISDGGATTTTTHIPTEGEDTTTTTTTVNTTAPEPTTDGGIVTPPTTAPTTTAPAPSKPTATQAPTTGKTDPPKTTATTQSLLPTYDILWANTADGDYNDASDWRTHGKNIRCHICVAELLKNGSNSEKIAIRAELPVNKDFVYNGQTIEMYGGYYYCLTLPSTAKLAGLLAEGDLLKYGEKLYTIGTPDGVMWTKEKYEQKVAYYGEKVLSRYIVDGEFLREKAESHYKTITTAEGNFLEACKAYKQTIVHELTEPLKQLGIDYVENPITGDVVFFATADELAMLDFDGIKEYFFHWATEDDCWTATPTRDNDKLFDF